MLTTIDNAADFIIVKLDEPRHGLNTLKLQKLAYYAQAWHLALTGEPLFDGKFQAWVHGPVNRRLYDRFAASHLMFDQVGSKDILPTFDLDAMPKAVLAHLNEVLEAYAGFSAVRLENMTHSEDPWIQARGTLKTWERCENEIDENLMTTYYRGLLEEPA